MSWSASCHLKNPLRFHFMLQLLVGTVALFIFFNLQKEKRKKVVKTKPKLMTRFGSWVENTGLGDSRKIKQRTKSPEQFHPAPSHHFLSVTKVLIWLLTYEHFWVRLYNDSNASMDNLPSFSFLHLLHCSQPNETTVPLQQQWSLFDVFDWCRPTMDHGSIISLQKLLPLGRHCAHYFHHSYTIAVS